jgi:hypothetical protein
MLRTDPSVRIVQTAGLRDPSPQSLRGQPVSTRYGVGVDVQRGGDPGVAQARRHNRDGGAGIEHLGCLEMAKVVEPERSKPGGAP